MRSWLFVPADSERKIEKALASNADIVILDLEDSVSLQNKAAARQITAQTLENRLQTNAAIYIRVNSLDTGLTQTDLDAFMQTPPDGLMLPKAEKGADVETASQMAGGQLPIIAIATETAPALFNLGTYGNLSANLAALTWGAEDLSNALGAMTSRDESGELTDPYKIARSLCLFGARAAGVEPIDTVYTAFKDFDGLESECNKAVRDGFTGKMAIHPAQVDVINKVFTPTNRQINQAQAIIEAFIAEPNAGVVAIEGRMYDLPHLARAQGLIKRAQRFTNS